jgi:hypothetical protein
MVVRVRARPEADRVTLCSATQEREQLRRRLVGQLFGNEVAGWHRQARHRRGALCLPGRDRIEQAADDAALAPEDERLAGDLVARGARGPIVLEVDRRRGAVVLARGVDRVGAAEAALGERVVIAFEAVVESLAGFVVGRLSAARRCS